MTVLQRQRRKRRRIEEKVGGTRTGGEGSIKKPPMNSENGKTTTRDHLQLLEDCGADVEKPQPEAPIVTDVPRKVLAKTKVHTTHVITGLLNVLMKNL